MLHDYNAYLTEIAKNNRPQLQAKKMLQLPEKQMKFVDDAPKEIKPVHSVVTNMGEIKRAFFNKDYETFVSSVKQPFKFYGTNCRFSSDNNGRPGCVLKNLLHGLSRTWKIITRI